MKYTPNNIINLEENQIFVFGSNEAGIHGGGAALMAKERFGAKWGKGVGLTGRTYAIPTKDKTIKTLPLDKIQKYVNKFIKFAKQNPDKEFLVTKIGCGLAGYSESDIGPLFKAAMNVENITLPREFLLYINNSEN